MNLFGEDDEDEIAVDAAELDGGNGDVDTAGEPRSGILPPSESHFFIGHSEIERTILKLYNSGKMPHAIILSGAEGIGKFTFAYRFARFLLAQKLDDPMQDALFAPEPDDLSAVLAETLDISPDHPIFRRVASGGHSDLIVAERKFDEDKNQYKPSVEVDEIRKIAPFLRMTAAEGGWRVAIINDADTMTRAAQNSILKILEEPPQNTVLILVTHRLGALIPTIRSRARVVSFPALDIESFSALLMRQGYHLGAAEVQALYTLSEASIGRAFDLIENGGLDMMGKVIALFEDYPDWKWSSIHVIAEDLARAGNAVHYKMFENVMEWIARQIMVAKARQGALPAGPLSSKPLFAEMLAKTSLENLVKICENLQTHFTNVQRGNLEKRQAVLRAFSLFS
jgi:DNA polymerase-3 subunit delta'